MAGMANEGHRVAASPQIVPFPGTERAALRDVGVKGHSLIRMVQAGLPVPPGVIITAPFFEPWFDAVRASATWQDLADAHSDCWATICADLKTLCLGLSPTDVQTQVLARLHEHLAAFGDSVLYAVRSSSPDEDQESASFAGGYATRLGVQVNDLNEAIRHCFASTLDPCVFAYKRQHGFDILSPRMAIIVQVQIDSEVAGVGFSLNPLTNDYDEAVVDANWGQGESVVAGSASPDHFVIDKPDRRVVERKRGAKQVSVWLGSGGGTVERTGHRPDEFTLTDVQLLELTDAICQIEQLYAKPVDIEWAYATDRLHILQARPITTYVPLPPEMLTRPGKRRRLYADAALSKGLTTNEPISQLGLSWLDHMHFGFLKSILGIEDFSPASGLVFTAGSRFYLNVSNYMWLGMSPETMGKGAAATDALLAETLADIDPREYRAPKPPWVRLRLLLLVPRLLWMSRGLIWNLVGCLLAPERARRLYQRKVDAFESDFVEKLDYGLPIDKFARKYTDMVFHEMFNVTMPALMAGLVSPRCVIPKNSEAAKSLGDKLRRGFTGNLVVEQGIALFRLAKLLDRSDFTDVASLAERIENRELSTEFMSEWDAFLQRFGCRGPREMDVASPRYADDPTLALEQMSSMAVEDGFDPEVAHQRNVDERRLAFGELLKRLSWLRRGLLRHVYRLIESFGGTRDTPKYHAVMLTNAIRKRALIEGEQLVSAGRLDVAEHIFDLTFDDILSATHDLQLDLRELRAERTHFEKQLAAHVTEFPQVIDSRGRILRPPPRAGKPNELVGMAVSPGTVTGRVRVLRKPRDNPIDKGDVLVAYTTDPGWTPLFVNASAIVLEVGGLLQHGAVIAREYGKPCVVGIDRVVTKLHDGQQVEVDGTAGVVRILS